METSIHIIGFLLLWMATDVGRTPSSKIEMFSDMWWFILILLAVGSLLTGYTTQ